MNNFLLSDGSRVHLIGDPHLGKSFKTGVPVHRLGEREFAQRVRFVHELHDDADIIVMVGDLFDHPAVTREVVLQAAMAALSAAENNPDVLYIYMRGNHDQARNLSKVGAWPLFRRMVADRHDNLIVCDEPTVVRKLAILPWEWERTTEQQVEVIKDQGPVEHAIGHWDLVQFDDDGDHMAPVASLRAAFGEIGLWSGHFHRPGVYPVDGVDVNCTGSMMPYAHGEDPYGEVYVTITAAEAAERTDLANKCVRILLQPGEKMPEIDCLALTRKVVGEAKSEKTVLLDDYDFQNALAERIKPLDETVRSFIQERININAASAAEE